MLRIYVDEVKATPYLLVATTTEDAKMVGIRRTLRSHVLPGQRRIHFHAERPSRRESIFKSINECDFSVTIFISHEKPHSAARDRCLEALVAHAIQSNITEIVLERDESLEQREKKFLAQLLGGKGQPITYRHEPAYLEPALWVSDAVGWAFRRGGDWRSRVRKLGA